jgi:hypothetical protein
MASPILRKKLARGEFIAAPGLQDMIAAVVATRSASIFEDRILVAVDSKSSAGISISVGTIPRHRFGTRRSTHHSSSSASY